MDKQEAGILIFEWRTIMAKINITVDIDWLDDVNFDDMLKDEILYGIRNYLKD